MKTREKYILTNEDWYPNYFENKLRVKICVLTNRKNRVCIWGADDFGMEKDFPENQKMEALKCFYDIKDFITEKELKEMGFINA